MHIYFESVGSRLSGLSYENSPPDLANTDKAWFWVVHPAYSASDFMTDVEYKDIAERCIENGGAILFIKGTRFSGEDTKAVAEALERKHKLRIHCLRVAVSSDSKKIISRIGEFLRIVEQLKPSQPIPWAKVEPKSWPENLVAIYLLLKALEVAPHETERIRKAWDDLDPQFRQQLWRRAWVEYCEERDLKDSEWVAAGLPDMKSEGAIELPEQQAVSRAASIVRMSFVSNIE
jgi:hypothetical protein